MKRIACFFVLVMWIGSAPAQTVVEKVDTAMMSKIRDEGLNHSHAAEILEGLTDICGERLTWSPEFKGAAEWVEGKLTAWNVANVRLDPWEPAGKPWTIRRFSIHMIEPQTVPLIGVPRAWSPGTDGAVSGPAVLLEVKSDSDFAKYQGKLKKAFVLISDIHQLDLDFVPFATRTPDSTLLKLANAEAGQARRRGFPRGDTVMMRRYRLDARLLTRKLEFCLKEGARAIVDVTPGNGGTGTVMTGAASVPQPADAVPGRRVNAFDPKAPEILPQVTLTAEHYDRIARLLKQGIPVRLEMDLEVKTSDKAMPGDNVLGEIPGTDLKDEVVMIGAHLDSWHAGTGGCDNGTGVTTAMEAMRILKAIGAKPRRTIRIGLWGGEEQGLFGSRGYVARNFAERGGDFRTPQGPVKTKPAYDKFCAYFNDDNGSGKFRGIYLQGNEGVRRIFRAWLAPFQDLGASTISAANTGGTDHLSFDQVGLPGFQFIQDPLEYGRTYHTNFDTYERASVEDVKQSAVIMAAFAYDAAMRDQMLPRKPMDVPVEASAGQPSTAH